MIERGLLIQKVREKGPFDEGQNEGYGPLKIFLLCKYLKVPTAYESLNPALVKFII
jgi:hypothetical protein